MNLTSTEVRTWAEQVAHIRAQLEGVEQDEHWDEDTFDEATNGLFTAECAMQTIAIGLGERGPKA